MGCIFRHILSFSKCHRPSILGYLVPPSATSNSIVITSYHTFADQDYCMWALAGWSFATIAAMLTYTVRSWRDFLRHQQRMDEEIGLKKRDHERKKKPIGRQIEQDVHVLKAEAKLAVAAIGEENDLR